MRFIEGSIAASALLASVAASPIELQPRAKDFIVHQTVRKPLKSGPAAVLSVYGKYNATAPSDVIKAAAANDGTVSANPEQYDSQYLSPVTIGGQTLNLDFDTGSSDLYVTMLRGTLMVQCTKELQMGLLIRTVGIFTKWSFDI